jgi:hypothetical protein
VIDSCKLVGMGRHTQTWTYHKHIDTQTTDLT